MSSLRKTLILTKREFHFEWKSHTWQGVQKQSSIYVNRTRRLQLISLTLFFHKMTETLEIYLDYSKITKYWQETLQPAALREHLKSLLSSVRNRNLFVYYRRLEANSACNREQCKPPYGAAWQKTWPKQSWTLLLLIHSALILKAQK